jgi:hypothetical protein
MFPLRTVDASVLRIHTLRDQRPQDPSALLEPDEHNNIRLRAGNTPCKIIIMGRSRIVRFRENHRHTTLRETPRDHVAEAVAVGIMAGQHRHRSPSVVEDLPAQHPPLQLIGRRGAQESTPVRIGAQFWSSADGDEQRAGCRNGV